MKYINVSQIKQLVKKNGRRAGRDFLSCINAYIYQRVEEACEIKNGGKVTLDEDIANHVGFNTKKQI